jgi:uncharacterized membrane protein YeaQ/YmgE (transglycosylase-associated protein family)
MTRQAHNAVHRPDRRPAFIAVQSPIGLWRSAEGGTAATEGAMTLESLIILIIIGAIAGWLAGQIMKGGGFGLVGDIIVGIVGSFIGSWLWGVLHLPGIGPWWLTAIISATVGACVLLFLLRLVKR